MNQKLINAWKFNADTNGKMKMLVVNEYVNVKIQCRHQRKDENVSS